MIVIKTANGDRFINEAEVKNVQHNKSACIVTIKFKDGTFDVAYGVESMYYTNKADTEITPYWAKRFLKDFPVTWRIAMDMCIAVGDFTAFHGKEIHPIYTHVCFRYGYTKRCFIHKIDSITIGRGNPEWGAPTDRDVFIIKHHKESLPFVVGEDFKTYTDEQLKAMSKADANASLSRSDMHRWVELHNATANLYFVKNGKIEDVEPAGWWY